MKNLRGATPLPGCMLERRGHGEIEAPADRIGQRYIKQINIIDNFGPIDGALGLFLRPDEVPMGTLFT